MYRSKLIHERMAFLLFQIFLFCYKIRMATAFCSRAFQTDRRFYAPHPSNISLKHVVSNRLFTSINHLPWQYRLNQGSLSTAAILLTSSSSQGGSKNPNSDCYYPDKIEDWKTHHVEQWLLDLGYEQYMQAFASDSDGIGVDGERLVYLGTPDQLDHIEWQMSCLGVEKEQHQLALSHAIEQLVSEGPVKLGLSSKNGVHARKKCQSSLENVLLVTDENIQEEEEEETYEPPPSQSQPLASSVSAIAIFNDEERYHIEEGNNYQI